MFFKNSGIYSALLFGGISTAATTNMVTNSSFENSRKSWRFYDNGMSSIIKTDAPDGQFVLRINDQNTKAGSSVRSRMFKVAPGQCYRLTFQAKVESSQKTTNIAGVYFTFRSNKKIFNKIKEKTQIKLKDTNNKWNSYQKIITAPESAITLQIWIHSYKGTTGKILLDKIELQRVNNKISKSLVKMRDLSKSELITGLDLNNLPKHPRLFWKASDTENVKKAVKTSPFLSKINDEIFNNARKYLNAPKLTHRLSGVRMLHISQKAFSMISVLAYAYRLSGDKRYADKAIEIMEDVCQFKDWNPRHFLDCAEMTAAVAIGYDWLYNQLNEKQKKLISTAILNLGLVPAWSKNMFWQTATSNWAQVCYGGLSLGALVVADEYPDIAKTTIARSFSGIKNPLSYYEPAGAYPEGAMYWIYGTTYNILFFDALERCGAKINYPKAFLNSSKFFLNSIGPTGIFNYSDANAVTYISETTFWFKGKGIELDLTRQKNSFLVVARKKRFSRFIAFLPIWYSKLKDEDKFLSQKTSTIWSGNGPGAVGFVKVTNKHDTLFAGIKLGAASQSHAHMDVGTFVFDAQKERWAIDLGSIYYYFYEKNRINLWNRAQNSDRWRVMAYSQNGHNIFTIDGKQQNVQSSCEITKTIKRDNYYAIETDISSAYKGQLDSACRTIAIVDKNYCTITDKVANINKQQTFQWNVNVPSSVHIKDNEALISKNGKAVKYLIVEPKGLRWEKIPRTYHFKVDKAYSEKHFSDSVKIGFRYKLQPNKQQTFKVSIIPELKSQR